MRSKTKLRLAFLVLCLTLVSASSAHAQVSRVTDYKGAVRNGITYLDLLRKIFPDVEMDSGEGQDAALAQTSVPLNHLFGDYKNKAYRGKMRITDVFSPGDQSRSRGQLLLLVRAQSDDGELFNWGDMNVLALFQLEPTVRLLDAADTQADRFAGFWEEQPLLSVSPQHKIVVIANQHSNSSQGYLVLTLVSAENNKLRTIFELPTLLNRNECGGRFTQTPIISVMSRGRSARPNLSVEVKLVKEPDDESCEKRTKGYTQYYRALLVWNSAKRMYESRGNALARLARLNERAY